MKVMKIMKRMKGVTAMKGVKSMKGFASVAAIACLAVGLTGGAWAMQTTQPTFSRTMLQDHPLSIRDRHAVMSRSEFQPGASSGRHTHPGEELGYVLEGTLELTIDGKAPQRLKAGDVIFMPAGAVHDAKNVGTGPLRVVSTYVLEVGKPLATPVK
jgi:quercetin dioxygenase-like cupin family protein